MGTLMGHVLPGTFFALFAIWWGFCIAVKHFHSRHSTKKSRKPITYQSSTTFSCLCCPSASLRQIPIESYFKLICVTIGILGEAVTGLKHEFNPTLNRKAWTFVEVNAQHIVMFFSFGFASLIEILVQARYNFPRGIEFLANIFAFGIEGFLFHFHLHGRDDVDIHVHTLLVYNIAFCFIASVWEYNRQNQILASYCRIAATFLQGIWFYAAGFILYFPSKDPYWVWAPGHTSILLITVMFVWFALFTCIFLFIQSALIWSILKRRYRDLHEYDLLENDDGGVDDDVRTNGKTDNHQMKSLKPTNGSATINFNDDDDSDSQLEFEQSKLFSSKI